MSLPEGPPARAFVTASGIPVDRVYTREHLAGIAPSRVHGTGAAAACPPIVISGCEMREAGATAFEELAFVLERGIELVEQALRDGRDLSGVLPRLCLRLSVESDFFEEIAKLRAARRLWARVLRDRFGVDDERGLSVRLEARVSARRFEAHAPYENVVRAALAALAAVSGGADGVDTSPLAESGGLPEDRGSALAALVTQAILHESGVAGRPDAFGGSYFVEYLTAELERRALELVGPAGGVPPRER